MEKQSFYEKLCSSDVGRSGSAINNFWLNFKLRNFPRTAEHFSKWETD